MRTTPRILSCSLPDMASDEIFLSSLQRKVSAYPVDLTTQKTGEHGFRLVLSGEDRLVKNFTESVQEELGGWGGRAKMEPIAG